MYPGDSWVGQVSAGTEPVDICYNQAVTQRLSIGGQGQFSAAQRAVGLLYGFKYNTPRYVRAAEKKGRWTGVGWVGLGDDVGFVLVCGLADWTGRSGGSFF